MPQNGRSRRSKKRSFAERWKRMSPRKRKKFLISRALRLACLLAAVLVILLLAAGVKTIIRRVSGDGTSSAGQDAAEAVLTETAGTEEDTEAIVTEPVISTLTLTAVGDCALGNMQKHSYDGSFNNYYDDYGEEYFFENVRSIFEADDLTIANLECVLTEETERVEKTFNLKGKPSYTGIMTCSSIEAVSLGNNHTRDYGDQSRIDTEDALDQAGIVWALDDKIGYYTTDQGLTVGIISELIIDDTEEKEQVLLDDIAACKEQGVNLTVVCCHWGIEKDYYPQDSQVELAHKLIDAGADLILGCHPHVLQGLELYNGKMIIYSLGNFCFGGNKNPSDKNTMIYQQTFTFSDGILRSDLSVKVTPARVSSESDKNDYQPMIAKDSKQSILDNLNEYSEDLSNISFDSDGNMIVGEEAESAEESISSEAADGAEEL